MKSLTIVHVVHYFLPRHRHGVELATYELAKAQAVAGHRVVVIAGETGRDYREISVERDEIDGLELWRIYFHPRCPNGYLDHPELGRRIAALIERVSADVVHIQHLSSFSLSVVHSIRDAGVPAVMTLHDYALICARTQLLRGAGSLCTSSNLLTDCYRCLRQSMPLPASWKLRATGKALWANLGSPPTWLRIVSAALVRVTGVQRPLRLDTIDDFHTRNDAMRRALARLNYLISPADHLARRFERFVGLREGTVQVIPQTVDLSRCILRPCRPQGRPLRLGFVGKLVYHKGLHVLLRAIGRLPSGYAQLQVYGSPTWTNVREVAYYLEMQRLGQGLNVFFHPKGFPPQEAYRAFDSFDVLVVPSIWYETFGRVVLEAFASGVPVVCSDIGGPAELVRDGKDGIHFRAGDDEDLARVLRRIAEHPEEVERLSENIQPVKPLDIYAREVEAVYRHVIEEASKAEQSASAGGSSDLAKAARG